MQNPKITEKQRKHKLIEDAFFRGLREGETVVDNSCETIAKELGLKKHYVSKALNEILLERELKIINRKFKLYN